MPRKIRDLVHDLEAAGFENRGGKGSHRNYAHPSGAKITISGRSGDDAKAYQEAALEDALEQITGEVWPSD